MKIRLMVAICAVLAGVGISARAEDGPHRIGAGVNYWTAMDKLDAHNIDNHGFGYVLSYQYKPGLVGVGVDAELLPDRFGQDSYAPQAYVLLGGIIYAGAGIGIIYADDKFANDPFYSFRAGLDLPVLPSLHLDIYGQYRFESKQDLNSGSGKNIDTDTIFLGAAVRFVL